MAKTLRVQEKKAQEWERVRSSNHVDLEKEKEPKQPMKKETT
jgi:hypothetical protein